MRSALAAVAMAAPGASAELPQMYVRAAGAIRDEPKVAARVRLGRVASRAAIEVRGQSSQRFPKKSYALETRTSTGANRDVSLLGLPADDDWVLYAAYNDKTLMRNVVAYATARLLGRYAPRTRFVALHVNGRYEGVYVLVEAPKLHDHRVAQGDALMELTFSFQARRKGGPRFRTPVLGRWIIHEDPERPSAAARRVVGRAERSLYRGRDWRRWMDESAAVDYVLVQELFKNVDAFHASTYFTTGPKLRLGPVWDFDLSSGNSVSTTSRLIAGWQLTQRPWAERLHRDRAFRRALGLRWRELRGQGLRRDILREVDRAAAHVRPGVDRNFARWPILHTRVWPNPAARGSWTAEVRFLRGWLNRRITWLDGAMRRYGR